MQLKLAREKEMWAAFAAAMRQRMFQQRQQKFGTEALAKEIAHMA